ncbi:MAG: hypothetical protein AVDCRST_MAG19-2051 [uncultured Thermomicrobiales bacterium]|uniref:Uncharacterized protein n=1 Tax=uncultured Thermomicrobiales bacterium TaxID=1645740 RepID=A0A6J4UZM6_9BACT|nr:MAG: hypothetical protein AVDCRST_MAG19-2051 [uncultured Thermomicrobiales bacterium]
MFAAAPAECRVRDCPAIPRGGDHRPPFAIAPARRRSIPTSGRGRTERPAMRLSISGGPDRRSDGSGGERVAEPLPGGVERFGVNR